MEINDVVITFCNGHYLVWEASDAILIKNEWKIVGYFIGSSAVAQHQNQYRSLPLELSKIEVKFILESFPDKAKLVKYHPNVIKEDFCHKTYQQKVKKNRAKQLEAQNYVTALKKKEKSENKPYSKCTKKTKLKTNNEQSDDLSVGSLNDSKSSETVLTSPSMDNLWIVLSLTNGASGSETILGINDISFTKHDEVLYKAFCDFHHRGYFLSCGHKFGGDYLVYDGDPGVYHSSFVLQCFEDEQHFHSLTKNVFGRSALSVKKCFVVCFPKEDGKLKYKYLRYDR